MATTYDWMGGAMSGLLSGGAGGSLQNAQVGVSYQSQAQMQNAMAQQHGSQFNLQIGLMNALAPMRKWTDWEVDYFQALEDLDNLAPGWRE